MKRIFIMLIVAMLSFSVDAQNLSTKEVSEAYAEAMKSNSYQNSIKIEMLKNLPFLNVWKKTEKYALV